MKRLGKTASTCVIIVMTFAAGTGCRDNEIVKTPIEMSTSAVSHGAANLIWETDWDTALKRAATENRPVLVNFYADWCIWCKRLDSTTFDDRDVIALLGARVVPLRLKIDGAGSSQAKEFRVQAPPTLLFVDADGTELGRILGYVSPTNFLARMNHQFPAKAS